MSLKLAIIGFGKSANRYHLPYLLKQKNFEVKYIFDLKSNPYLEEQYSDYSINFVTDIETILADKEVTVVTLCTPPSTHYELGKRFLESGKNVVIEKPFCENIADAIELQTIAKKRNLLVQPYQNRRFDSDYLTLKKVLDLDYLGDLIEIESQFNYFRPDTAVKTGGQMDGAFYGMGVHLIDQILWMIPTKLQTVYADVRNVINEKVDDYFNIQLYFENGINAQIELGTYFLNSSENWFERHWFIGGNEGSAKIDGFNPKGEITRTSELLGNVPGQITMTHAGPTRSFGPAPEGRILTEALPEVDVSHRMFFDNYYAAVSGKEELTIQPEEILRLMQVVEAIRTSAKYHQSIHFE